MSHLRQPGLLWGGGAGAGVRGANNEPTGARNRPWYGSWVLYPLAIGLLAVGAVCWAVAAVALWRRHSLGAEFLGNQVNKLVTTGNRERAIKITMAVAETAVGKLTLVALQRRLPKRDPEAAASHDYRGRAGGRPFEQRVHDMLVDEAQMALAPVRGARWLGLAGAFIALGGAALSWPHAEWPLAAKIAATVGPVLLGVMVLVKTARIVNDVRLLVTRFAPFVQPED